MDQRLHHDYVLFMVGLAEYEARLEAERGAPIAAVGRTLDGTPAGVVRLPAAREREIAPVDGVIHPAKGVTAATDRRSAAAPEDAPERERSPLRELEGDHPCCAS